MNTEEARAASREKALERHRRYNGSKKGQARNQRYEQAHPERKTRWEQARNAVRPRAGW